ncbi:hypothetical protein K435DRAFT_872393 [Dendrothele bispora CBS 962.96]|uniref:Retrovirus-related Pol polyprotein from transposon TNT 1-94-like beta-barrel domain-containing protein n=1 Tax=Dendrothele bispora (strain CBS 962.96) TaxID=1314807 RepID=A0A4S8L1Q8_DENBC|nr:hypothetical protein K435DRAFT_872393 [Dendrothele bispora CBS 962.96]
MVHTSGDVPAGSNPSLPPWAPGVSSPVPSHANPAGLSHPSSFGSGPHVPSESLPLSSSHSSLDIPPHLSSANPSTPVSGRSTLDHSLPSSFSNSGHDSLDHTATTCLFARDLDELPRELLAPPTRESGRDTPAPPPGPPINSSSAVPPVPLVIPPPVNSSSLTSSFPGVPPTLSFSSTSSLPTVTHIPILKDDPELWSKYLLWWKTDSYVAHVLSAHLSSSILAFLPDHNDSTTGLPHTLRAVLNAIKQFCNVNNTAAASLLKEALFSRTCGPWPTAISTYCEAWCSDIGTLRTIGYRFDWSDTIFSFLSQLPPSLIHVRDVLWDSLAFHTDLDSLSLDWVISYTLQSAARNASFNMRCGRMNPNRAYRKCSDPSCSCSSVNGSDRCATHGGAVSNNRTMDNSQSSKPCQPSLPQANVASVTVPSSTCIDSPDVALDPVILDDDVGSVDSCSPTPVPTSFANEKSLLDLYLVCPPESVPALACAGHVLEDVRNDDVDNFTSILACFNIILDSGANRHLFRDCSLFFSFDPETSLSIRTTNCGEFKTLGSGKIRIRVALLDSVAKFATIVLCDCHYAPDLPLDLLHQIQ